MMDEYFVDSETVGFVGPMILFQYAKNNGPVVLHDVWKIPARKTIELMETVALNKVTGFNLVFDHFHMQKIHSMLSCLGKRQLDKPPTIEAMMRVERMAPLHGLCLKPASALDIYLQLMIGPFQCLMERKPIIVRRVPVVVAPQMMELLTQAFQFDWIYFKRRKDESGVWKAAPCKDKDPQFVDLKFSFGASRSLKSIHRYVFGKKPIMFPMPEELHPFETAWSPYHDDRPDTWPFKIQGQIEYWSTNAEARQYGADDVTMVRDLQRKYKFKHGDLESTLACMIGSVRYRGSPINIKAAQQEYKKSSKLAVSAGNLDWRPVKAKLQDLCTDDLERMSIESTKDEALEAIEKWVDETGREGAHPAAKYAKSVRQARAHRFRASWLEKILLAKRFHPSLNPMGTLTRRASGSGGLNPLNLDKEKSTRRIFLLADSPKTFKQYSTYFPTVRMPPSWSLDFTACGGDFDSFETVLAIAAWQDKILQKYVDKGVKPYHVFGSYLYRRALGGPSSSPSIALVSIQRDCLDTGHGKKCKCHKEQYGDRAKNCWYALIYGAQEFKISQTAGVSIEEVAEALKSMGAECVGMAAGRQKVFDDLACIIQDQEHGPFMWREPKVLVPNLLGWDRDFSFDVQIIHQMFDFPRSLPRDWAKLTERVIRKNREQSILGACHSALFGSAKQMEARIKRQAGNCIMQSTGAMYCKELQRTVWDRQPAGAHEWQVVTLNIYDEIEAGRRSRRPLKSLVDKAVAEFKKKIPLIAMEWKDEIDSWAGK